MFRKPPNDVVQNNNSIIDTTHPESNLTK